MKFNLLFTEVLTCSESPPIVENSVQSYPVAPYLAGLAVMEYRCKDEYQFNSSDVNSTVCEAKMENKIIGTEWSDTSDVLCIPGRVNFVSKLRA